MTSTRQKQTNSDQYWELESKRFNFHLHIQRIHQGFCMSKHLYKLGSLFEYLLFNDPTEFVLLNDIEETYSKLKREYYVWYGEGMPRQSLLPARTKRITKFQELQQLSLKLKRQNVPILLFFSYGEQQFSKDPLNLELLSSNVHLFPVNKYSTIDKHMKKIQENGSGHKEKSFLPNFYQLSSDIKSQINSQKFNLFWMLSGQNIQKAYLDFYKFFKYFLVQENVMCPKIEQQLLTYREEYENSSFMRTAQMEILFYTKNSHFHKIINNSLRTFINAEDFAYIRFPFLRIFLTVNELFIMQSKHEFRKTSFYCYRGCILAQSEIKLLDNSVNKYVQITTFLSSSMQKEIAQTFGTDLIIIQVPSVRKCTTMLHSFASIKQYSTFYAEEEILFNPLNIFLVQKIEKIDKSHIIHLKYMNAEELLAKDRKSLSGKDLNLVENYIYQKQMFCVNRNQGQYLWRLSSQQDANRYYQQKFKIHLKAAKALVQKSDKRLNHQIIGKYLYDELKIFVKDFQWLETEQQNLKLIDIFMEKNSKRAIQLYLYASKIHEYALNYERCLSYLLVSGIKSKKIINPKSIAYYFILSCLGLSVMNLDQIKQAKRVFQLASTNLPITCNLDKIYYPFIIVHAILTQQTRDFDERKQISLLFQKCVEKNQPYGLEGHPWLKFIQNFEDIKVVKEFVQYYTKTYDKMLIFIRRQICYVTEELLLKVENLDYQNSRENSLRWNKNQKLNQQISIAGYLLEKAKPHARADLPFVNCLIQTLKISLNYNKSIITSEQFVKKWQQEEQQIQKLNSLSYYQFRLHLISLKYITKIIWNLGLHQKNITSQAYRIHVRHFMYSFQLIMTKFRNKYYLHLLFVISLCQLCIYRNFDVFLLKFVKILNFLQKKVGQILTLHMDQINLVKKILARKFFRNT